MTIAEMQTEFVSSSFKTLACKAVCDIHTATFISNALSQTCDLLDCIYLKKQLDLL